MARVPGGISNPAGTSVLARSMQGIGVRSLLALPRGDHRHGTPAAQAGLGATGTARCPGSIHPEIPEGVAVCSTSGPG